MSDRNIFLQRQKLPFSVPSFFPVDIEESVIDQLRDDVQALRNCALTCRTWHLRSRYHLVQSIRVTTRTAYSDLCDFFKDNKTLGRSVKTLSVCPTEDEPKPVSLLAVALVPLPSHLPQLRTYKLRNLRADSLSSPLSFHATTLACLKHYLPNVQELILDSVSLSNEAELARLARSFPSLGAIRCENVRLRDRRAISSGVSAAYTDKLFLSTLSLRCVGFAFVESITDLCMSSLESLILDLDHEGLKALDSARGCISGVITSLTKLKTFHLSVIHSSDQVPLVDFLQRTSRILEDVKHPALRKVTISFPHLQSASLYHQLVTGKQDVTNSWSTLDEVLVSLGEARVVLTVPDLKANRAAHWTSTLGSRFPKMRARGALPHMESPPAGAHKLGHDGAVAWLEIRPDLGCVISGSIDGMILVWDIHHGDVIREFRLRSSLGVRSAAFCPSPGSDRFACIEGHNVAIWDIRGRRIAALNGPTTISAYAWTPDGKHLLSTYAYARSSTKDDVPVLHLWATADDGDNYRLIDTMLAPSFSEPQKSQGLLMQKANVGGPLEKTFMQYAQDLPNHVKGLFFSPGSAVFIVSIGKPKFNDTTGHDRREVQCRIQHWDMESSPRSSRDIKKDTQISVCAFSPVPFPSSIIPISAARLPGPFKYDDPQNTHSDTSWVSPTPCDCFAVGFASGEVEMIYLRRSVGLKESPGNYAFRTALYRHDAMVTSIVFHERLLLSTSADATFKVVHWVVHRPDKPFKVVTVTGHDDTVNAACFSPNGKFVASVSEDKTVRLWRTSGWSCVATFTEHTAPVTHVAFAPEGDTIWSAARNGTVRRHPFVHLVRGGV